jgi:hypothetical protein
MFPHFWRSAGDAQMKEVAVMLNNTPVISEVGDLLPDLGDQSQTTQPAFFLSFAQRSVGKRFPRFDGATRHLNTHGWQIRMPKKRQAPSVNDEGIYFGNQACWWLHEALPVG